MDIIPNLRIARSGFDYQKAAEVLEDSGLLWPAAINAALAIEMYLKSFLAKDTWKDYHSGGKYKTYEASEHGHILTKLFNKIPKIHRDELLNQVSTISPETDLNALLEKYKDVFFNARYSHEENALRIVDSGIIRLAQVLKQAIKNLTTPI